MNLFSLSNKQTGYSFSFTVPYISLFSASSEWWFQARIIRLLPKLFPKSHRFSKKKMKLTRHWHTMNGFGKFNRLCSVRATRLCQCPSVFSQAVAILLSGTPSPPSPLYTTRRVTLRAQSLLLRKLIKCFSSRIVGKFRVYSFFHSVSTGECHASVASSFNNLAMVYKEKGELNRALQMYEKKIQAQLMTTGIIPLSSFSHVNRSQQENMILPWQIPCSTSPLSTDRLADSIKRWRLSKLPIAFTSHFLVKGISFSVSLCPQVKITATWHSHWARWLKFLRRRVIMKGPSRCEKGSVPSKML